MLEDTFNDNIRQSKVVMKYELRKYAEGKKIVLFAALMAVILGLLVIMPYVAGDGLSDDPGTLASSFTSMVQFLVLLSATLFASGAIVSEYEERTGLLLFTKPVHKWSMYLGKTAAAFVIGALFIAVYYIAVIVISMIATGSAASGIMMSFGLSMLYLFAATGVAAMLSSIVKRASTAAILTFVLLLMILTIVTTVLTMNSIDAWFMLDNAAGMINDCITDSDGWVNSAVAMTVWGTITAAAGYAIFRKREF